MKNSISVLSVVTIVIVTLLMAGVITGISIMQDADAASKKINRGSTSASAEGGQAGTGGTGGSDGSGGAGGSGGTAIALIIQ